VINVIIKGNKTTAGGGNEGMNRTMKAETTRLNQSSQLMGELIGGEQLKT
jgi:hypothetical protein